MMRGAFLYLFTGLLCSALSASSEQLNVLLIVADDIGYEKLGCYGGIGAETPVLDQLAERGTLFARAYASPVCTPSRMSLYTGTYVPRHKRTGVLPVHEGTREAIDFERWPTYAQLLRNAGYRTAVTGKWQLAALEFHPEHCRSAGFDNWCVWQIWREGGKTHRYWDPCINRNGEIVEADEDVFGPDILTRFVISEMKAAKQAGQPFLIHHNMMLPHVPIVETPDDRKAGSSASLDRMIRYMDRQIGEVLDTLKELELERDTLVIFIGDNGTQAEEPRLTRAGPVSGGKWSLNDGGTHVPLIVSQPGTVSEGHQISDLVEISDLFPTICELTGVEIPSDWDIDGISFVGPLLKGNVGIREWVTAGIGNDFFVFDGRWRLHHIGERLVDCRKLPEEKDADSDDPEAQQAKEKLFPILDQLRKL